MGLRYRRRIGLRFALLGFGLILSSVLLAALQTAEPATATADEAEGLALTLGAQFSTVKMFGLAVALSLTGAAVVFAYSERALRPLEHLQRAITSLMEPEEHSGELNTTEPPDFALLDHEAHTALSRLRARMATRHQAELREIAITRAVLDNSTDGVITIDDHGRVLSINAAAEGMFGYSSGRIIGQNVSMLMPAPHSDQHDQYLNSFRRTGRKKMIGQETDVMGLRADFTTFPLRMAVSELELDGERVFTAIMRDITDSKRSEEALASSEARMRAILDTAADGIITLDEWGTVVSINVAAEEMFAYRAWEVVGKHLSDLMTAAVADEDGDDDGGRTGEKLKWPPTQLYSAHTWKLKPRRAALDPNADPAAAGAPDSSSEAPEGDPSLLSDGTSTRESPPKASGRGYGTNLSQHDTYGDDRGPSARGKSLSAVAGASNAQPSRTDVAGGRTEGRPSAEDNGSHTPPLAAIGHRRDGTTFPVELAISEVLVGNERIFTAIVRDVTDRAEAEAALARRAEELSRRNEELAQFAYVASHDLQEPLRMVSSYTQLLERRYKGQLDEDADEFISFAVDGANRMQRLLRGLLAYSRIGTHGLEFQPTDCEEVLDRVLANLGASLDECGAVVTNDPLPVVVADPSQMDQLLQNLLSNAIKFHDGEAPRVHVSVEQSDGEWHFSISDNGVGIDAQYHDRIFVIFQRLHTKDEYPGTGIGLAICKKIVERHSGRIWVESSPGDGSTFHFTLPYRPDVVGQESEPDAATQHGAPEEPSSDKSLRSAAPVRREAVELPSPSEIGSTAAEKGSDG